MKTASLEWRTFWGAWFGAILWNGMLAFGLIASLSRHSLRFHNPKDFLVLFFPVIGVVLLLWALRQTILWNVYGETFFTSETERFPPGSRFHGKIQFSRSTSVSLRRRFRLRLLCQMENPSSAGDRNRNTHTVWEDSHSVELSPDGTIPVLFSLPAELKPNVYIMERFSQMTWNLKVNEIGGGLRSFTAEYVLPAEDKIPLTGRPRVS